MNPLSIHVKVIEKSWFGRFVTFQSVNPDYTFNNHSRTFKIKCPDERTFNEFNIGEDRFVKSYQHSDGKYYTSEDKYLPSNNFDLILPSFIWLIYTMPAGFVFGDFLA